MIILENIKDRLHNYKPEFETATKEKIKMLKTVEQKDNEIIELKSEILQLRSELATKIAKISGLEMVMEISTKKRLALLQSRNSLAGKVGSISKQLKREREQKEQLQKTVICLNESIKKEKNKPTIGELTLYQSTGKRKVGARHEQFRDSKKAR